MSESEIFHILSKSKATGIRNILALRGDRVTNSPTLAKSEFRHAVDLVRYIRASFGDFFSIGVAGYPEGHPEAESLESDLGYLKEKVAAGADFVITQLFYANEYFWEFCTCAKKIGISVPIIPGIMPIVSYAGLMKMTALCKARIPVDLTEALEKIKDDNEAVKKLGVQMAVKMCNELICCGVKRLHFYTLNLDTSTTDILHQLGL
jgi:methylenetetrahydrofolate reductase (NADPH)